jgi:general secretion pathway protein G
MRTTRSGQAGFTLLEIIVVLAVVGALAAIMAPVVFRYVEDANVARAQGDVSAIASAVNKAGRDMGHWPFYADGTATSVAFNDDPDPSFLTSNPACEPAAASACDDTRPALGTATGWTVTLFSQYLGSQLVTNTPVYPTTGETSWLGPYLDQIPAVDPWGHSYLVNISQAAPANNKLVIAISAGPDGILQTSATTAVATEATAGGDDVIARIR